MVRNNNDESTGMLIIMSFMLMGVIISITYEVLLTVIHKDLPLAIFALSIIVGSLIASFFINKGKCLAVWG